MKQSWLASKIEVAYSEKSASLDVGAICILFMVFAIGTQYAYLESTECIPPNHNTSQAPGVFSEDALGVSFYRQACKLVPDVITVSSLESVQACLLVGLYTLPLDASGLSYVYLNLAVRLAIQNGMHRRFHQSAFVDDTSDQSNRVWWTAYTMEK